MTWQLILPLNENNMERIMIKELTSLFATPNESEQLPLYCKFYEGQILCSFLSGMILFILYWYNKAFYICNG